MAFVAESTEILGYTSGRVSPIPAGEGGGQELNLASVSHGQSAEELPSWIRLFHTDKTFQDFVNEVFFLSLDEEETPPAGHVVEQLLQLTPFAKTLLAQEWSQPWVTTDGSGGIRLSWRREAPRAARSAFCRSSTRKVPLLAGRLRIRSDSQFRFGYPVHAVALVEWTRHHRIRSLKSLATSCSTERLSTNATSRPMARCR